MPLNINKSSTSEYMSTAMNNRRKWIMGNTVSIRMKYLMSFLNYSGGTVNNNILSLQLICIGKDILIFL